MPSSKVKIILMGDAGVGKSCLAAVLNRDIKLTVKRLTDYISTKGAASISVYPDPLTKTIRYQLLDRSGNKNYDDFTFVHYQDATIVLLTFDLNSHTSFKHLDHWLGKIPHYINHSGYHIILVGTKNDLIDDRQVTPEAITGFCGELQQQRQQEIPYVAVSAYEPQALQASLFEAIQRFHPMPARAASSSVGPRRRSYSADAFRSSFFVTPPQPFSSSSSDAKMQTSIVAGGTHAGTSAPSQMASSSSYIEEQASTDEHAPNSSPAILLEVGDDEEASVEISTYASMVSSTTADNQQLKFTQRFRKIYTHLYEQSFFKNWRTLTVQEVIKDRYALLSQEVMKQREQDKPNSRTGETMRILRQMDNINEKYRDYKDFCEDFKTNYTHYYNTENISNAFTKMKMLVDTLDFSAPMDFKTLTIDILCHAQLEPDSRTAKAVRITAGDGGPADSLQSAVALPTSAG